MSLSDSEDELVTYGTPLEPLEEDEIPNKKPRLLEDQTVKDKQGRRRFHGAFTGGFSAGFFNTVGSLEGWSPATFKSSKSRKQEIFQQKPEDFMDEEDISEFGIAPLVLKARRDYSIENKTETTPFSNFLNLGTYVLQDILKHVRETVGIKLLKKMGWKPGQGVGPRLNKNEKINCFKVRQRTYGCQLPPGAMEEKENDSNSDCEWDDIQFAPSDYEPFICQARNNFYGMGYEGLDKRPVLSGNSHAVGIIAEDDIKRRNKKFAFGSQAFGVGAFEEEDEDIYARDDMSSYNFSLGKDEATDVTKSADKDSLKSSNVLEGFALEAKPRSKKNYPLPAIPGGFKPQHRIRRSRFDQCFPNSAEKTGKSLKGNYEERRKLLDEPREQVVNDGKQREDLTKNLISNVKIKESEFKPFSANPEKQERYNNYLKLIKIGKKELLGDLQPVTMTNWDKEREKVEFEKASLLFRPLSGGMEDRFSTASQPDDLSNPLAVVEKYFDGNDDRRKAAKMKMFGPVTRRTEDWIPCPLLCKRFNIPEPGNRHLQSSEKQRGKTYFNLFDSVENVQENVENIEKAEVSIPENSFEEPQTFEDKDQSVTDLYKAIFLASDDEEESNEANAVEKLNEDTVSGKTQTLEDEILYEEKLINSKRNLSPPKGIFENIDLELLCGKEKGKSSLTEESGGEKIQSKDAAETNVPCSDLVYGPRVPEKITAKSGFFPGETLKDACVWVEKKNHGKKKHKKKDKKSKKVSHKSKHKHKHKR